MRIRDWWLVLLLPSAGACVLGGAPVSAFGRPATVNERGVHTSGELLAASADTVWLLRHSRLRPIATTGITRVHVQRHTFGLGRTLKWLGLAGLGTGVALMAACHSYEASEGGDGGGAGCLGVLPGTLVVFAAAGLAFGGINELTTKHRVRATETDRLRAWSRYPQGIPDSLRRVPVVPGAP